MTAPPEGGHTDAGPAGTGGVLAEGRVGLSAIAQTHSTAPASSNTVSTKNPPPHPVRRLGSGRTPGRAALGGADPQGHTHEKSPRLRREAAGGGTYYGYKGRIESASSGPWIDGGGEKRSRGRWQNGGEPERRRVGDLR